MDLFRKKDVAGANKNSASLAQCLSLLDLTFLGIGAIIGAGIFVLTGIVAATQAGPAIMLSYVLAGLSCAFAAFSYAELAAAIGGSGSAYSYAYIGFGELLAWVVGWDLLLEYSISVSAVSVGWSSYVNDLMRAMKIHFPVALANGPLAGGVFNLLACSIILFLCLILIMGVKSSSRFNNFIVIVKLAVIALFIVVAISDANVDNWSPFLPYGWGGVVEGASLIFFAYIGFDAVSTTAAEAINPQKDLPKAIIGSLLICTVLYIIVSGLLTAITSYTNLNVPSPISHTLLTLGHKTVAAFISVGAIAGLTTVMLVFYYGLTRVFFAMAADGLLPHLFSKINPTTKTPVRIILLCALVIIPFAGLLPMHDLAELVNIGTLFAFIMVCIGVIYLRYKQPQLKRPFKTPGMPYVPVLGIISCSYLLLNLPWITLLRFFTWMLLGLIIYFSFSRKRSNLAWSNQK